MSGGVNGRTVSFLTYQLYWYHTGSELAFSN